MALTLLPEELILAICSELCVEDILRLRQTCCVLSTVTRTKVLWNHVLKRHGYMHGSLLSYLGGYESFEDSALETLACRVARLDARWEAGDLSPVRDYQLRLPQSITWLRLVAGTWLFVSSSDNDISQLTCWDVPSILRGNRQPLAEAYLPGQVKTGELEVQACGMVLALGLGPESSAVHLLTLQKLCEGYIFAELARVEGSSHVLMLHGDLVGCALRDGTIAPHLVNWKETKIHDIPQSDVPGQRSVPHLMAIRKNTLVLVRTNLLQMYSLPSAPGDLVATTKTITVPAIWEAVVRNSDTEPSVLRLVVLSPVGIEMCLLDVDTLTKIDDEPVYTRYTLAKQPFSSHSAPWYRLCVGESGRRCLWMSASEPGFQYPPHFVSASISSGPPDELATIIPWHQAGLEQAAAWALPVFDFDEVLGVTVVGNCFGELAIYDHVGSNSLGSEHLAVDLPHGQWPIASPLPTVRALPVSLNLSSIPRNPENIYTQTDLAVLSQWSHDDIDLGGMWRTDWWDHDSCSGYCYCDEWQGVLGDFAWKVEHVYGFAGKIIPQAYMSDEYFSVDRLLCRVGNRYLLYTVPSEMQLLSWPVYTSNRNRFFVIEDAKTECYARPTANTERAMYRHMFRMEREGRSRRNRWADLADRGGRVHANLLDRPPAFDPFDF
ncbi:hypothetical protein R3P38DRAFT_2601025 [Favolaschia claudopus]|uniref:F-box domain-containing protein n=1 Tax=Favolaschia claudopus TaxID=2862362 RepID=A0AAW0DXS0_9AGAR